jgi:hypothetical protein
MSWKTVAICEDHWYNEEGNRQPIVLHDNVHDECYLPGCHQQSSIFVRRDMQDIALVRCITCPVCGKSDLVAMYKREYDKWRDGMLIQEAAPELPVGDREMLMSGIHPDCWNILFENSEED